MEISPTTISLLVIALLAIAAALAAGLSARNQQRRNLVLLEQQALELTNALTAQHRAELTRQQQQQHEIQHRNEVELTRLQDRLSAEAAQWQQRLQSAQDLASEREREWHSQQQQRETDWQQRLQTALDHAQERERLLQHSADSTLQTALENERRRWQAELDHERRQATEKIELLNQARESLSAQFKALANDILEEKAKRFTEQNQANLGTVLEPLKLRLQEFQQQVSMAYVNETKERSALAEQVKQLMTLNQQLSSEAHNLTRALKGDNKAQGNWGEVVLERLLESAGLSQGLHYQTQESHVLADGRRQQPDVVIYLPENKYLVIDAKVSLLAYEELVNADEDAQRDAALKRHLDSLRAHIKGLSGKDYTALHGTASPDFVLMFLPVEPAFMLAIQHDAQLWQDAWSRNVLLVSPSTLLFVLRTVAHLWRQAQQSQNAQEIAKRGAELYDKLVGFVDDLQALGKHLGAAQKSFDGAFNKFSQGRGNLIRQAEMLKELGIKPSKTLPAPLTDAAQGERE